MHHLTPYDKFATFHKMKSVKADVEDMLLPLSDDGIDVSFVTSYQDQTKFQIISYRVKMTSSKGFDINEYRDDVNMVISYMYEKGWEPTRFLVNNARFSKSQSHQPDTYSSMSNPARDILDFEGQISYPNYELALLDPTKPVVCVEIEFKKSRKTK